MPKPTEEPNKQHLRAEFLQIVENQLRDNNPPEARLTLNRLLASGFSREDAVLLIAGAVCVEVYMVLRTKQVADPQHYLRNLAALPAEPHER